MRDKISEARDRLHLNGISDKVKLTGIENELFELKEQLDDAEKEVADTKVDYCSAKIQLCELELHQNPDSVTLKEQLKRLNLEFDVDFEYKSACVKSVCVKKISRLSGDSWTSDTSISGKRKADETESPKKRIKVDQQYVPTSSANTYRWQWCSDDGVFENYDDEAHSLLEKAFDQSQPYCEITVKNVKYIVDMQRFLQTKKPGASGGRHDAGEV